MLPGNVSVFWGTCSGSFFSKETMAYAGPMADQQGQTWGQTEGRRGQVLVPLLPLAQEGQ